MMGHRGTFKNGDEWDFLTRRGRRVVHKQSGEVAKVKRRFNKRQRKAAKQEIEHGT